MRHDSLTECDLTHAQSVEWTLGRWAQIVLSIVLCLLTLQTGRADSAAAKPLTVFAAASLTDVLQDVSAAFTANTGIKVRHVFAASSTLARQIENGARADMFISADQAWMDYLEARQYIAQSTRLDLLGNHLVIIAPQRPPRARPAATRSADTIPTVRRKQDMESILTALSDPRTRVTLADPSGVPLGRYSRSALVSLNLWSRLRPHLALADNSRSALALVARGESPLGIVYATDAMAEPQVKVLAQLSPDLHPKIVYPAALLRESANVTARGAAQANRGRAESYLEFLQSDAAAKLFRQKGFTSLVHESPAKP